MQASGVSRSGSQASELICYIGISKYFQPGLSVALSGVREHFEVNTIGVLALFQATYPLLQASTSTPKFIPISSLGGSITMGTVVPMPTLAYGISKAALNYLTRKLRAENEGLGTFPSGYTRR
jgi:NAD(P)-dependent dehydrogenase (short-subunit alcohol dehydrogenase family)